MSGEISSRVDFSRIRYAQCWEDADILLEALDIRPEHVCLSIASAGDNTLALLSRGPQKVIALDFNPAQIACLELRAAAYRELSHHELLMLIGSVTGYAREGLYRRCRPLLSPDARQFWDAHPAEIARGIGGAGKFERYFALFRRAVLPLIHSRSHIACLLQGGKPETRVSFYHDVWDTRRWRMLFHLFFSRSVLGRLGRDPGLFRYVEGSVSDRLLERARHAMTVLDPADNPYVQWILTGRHVTTLPYALRPENYENIRSNLDRLEWRCVSLEDFLDTCAKSSVDRFNLSDIFEYVSPEHYRRLLMKVLCVGRCGGRLAYWNMLVERRRPQDLADRLLPLTELARRLQQQDKAFFYSGFVVEEIAA